MITFEEVKVHGDGSADYKFSFDDQFIKYYKQETGRKVLVDEEVKKFIYAMLYDLASGKPPTQEFKRKSVKGKKKAKSK